MEKQIRLRRKIEHEPEPELTDNNESPIACVDCGKRYPMVTGSSNCRCRGCNTKFKTKVHFYRAMPANEFSKP